MRCFDAFSSERKTQIISRLNECDNKNDQDSYLQCLIQYHAVERHRSRNRTTESTPKPKTYSYEYYVKVSGETVKVCKTAYINLHGVSKKRVERLQKLLIQDKSPKDQRGRSAGSRHNAIPGDICLTIHDFIKSIPVHEVHYSNTKKYYFSSNLNMKILHNMFITKNPQSGVKYDFFVRYIHENFNIGFGQPQVDVCGYCEERKTKLRNPALCDAVKSVAAGELNIHNRRAKKFYHKMQEVQQLCKERDDVAGFVFDYMSNLPLPHIPVQEIFYYRQLWVYEFCIHNLKSGEAYFYSYHEGLAKKGPNEVCTCLLHCIMENLSSDVKQLYLFADNCPGQNKNHTVLRFLLTMTHLIPEIHYCFPVRGHSFNACDRDFGVAKRKIKREDRIYTPEEYETLIRSSSQKNNFRVISLETEDILNFKSWWPNHYKRNATSLCSYGSKTKVKFQMSMYSHFTFHCNSPGIIEARTSIDDHSAVQFSLLKGGCNADLPDQKAYSEPVPINRKKLDDLKKVLHYIPEEHKPFYDTKDGEDKAD